MHRWLNEVINDAVLWRSPALMMIMFKLQRSAPRDYNEKRLGIYSKCYNFSMFHPSVWSLISVETCAINSPVIHNRFLPRSCFLLPMNSGLSLSFSFLPLCRSLNARGYVNERLFRVMGNDRLECGNTRELLWFWDFLRSDFAKDDRCRLNEEMENESGPGSGSKSQRQRLVHYNLLTPL